MKKFLFTLSFLTPGVVMAANFNNITELISFFINLINKSIIPLLLALAVAYFLYGAGKFIKNAEDTNARAEGRQFMIYGVIALFVIVSFWGIVTLLSNTFGITNVIPQYKTSGSAECIARYGVAGCAELNNSGL